MECALKKYLPWLRVFENYPLEGHGTDLVKRFAADLIIFRKLLNRKKYTYTVKWQIRRVYRRLYSTHYKFVKIDALYARGTEARNPMDDYEALEPGASSLKLSSLPLTLGQTVE